MYVTVKRYRIKRYIKKINLQEEIMSKDVKNTEMKKYLKILTLIVALALVGAYFAVPSALSAFYTAATPSKMAAAVHLTKCVLTQMRR